ncbi:hypothetical protein OH77DRAFT_349912 [Trametes cingulata]|nr:hypothetical protein OH77DRAFT_349912 [Trametes cingulata]
MLSASARLLIPGHLLSGHPARLLSVTPTKTRSPCVRCRRSGETLSTLTNRWMIVSYAYDNAKHQFLASACSSNVALMIQGLSSPGKSQSLPRLLR